MPRYESFFRLLVELFEQVDKSQISLKKADQAECDEGGNISDWLNNCKDEQGQVEEEEEETEEQEFVFDEPEGDEEVEVELEESDDEQ
jgi:hypothetical protein